ncbi:hypothetical protein [Companilactobacillus metriopterae]|uniref:hypothetical protein n=1 Tax=Companilactobacillus metriopterae TaxID=1909267 RepID=UPI00100B4450|nr:hypothetical protein [Companilactobacillus metriopterae]
MPVIKIDTNNKMTNSNKRRVISILTKKTNELLSVPIEKIVIKIHTFDNEEIGKVELIEDYINNNEEKKHE